MRRMKMIALALVVALAAPACSFVTARPPVLTPNAAQAIVVGLDLLRPALVARPNTPPAVIIAIDTAKVGILADVSGKTWGGLLREMLTTVYTELPIEVQMVPYIAGLVAGIEAALATTGA